jgi:hypothetical protein
MRSAEADGGADLMVCELGKTLRLMRPHEHS